MLRSFVYKFLLCLSVYFVSVLSSASLAQADSFTVPMGQSVQIDNVSNLDSVDVIAQAGRCYCCEINSLRVETAGIRLSNITVFTGGNTLLTSKNRGRAFPALNVTPVDADKEARVCFSVSGSDAEGQTNRVRFTIEHNRAPLDDVVIRCNETTLIGGFNTSVTDFNFLELTNTMEATTGDDGVLSGTIIATNSVTDTQVVNQSFMINPGKRTDVNLHGPAGMGAFGPVAVCHDGPIGSLKAVVSQYRIVTTDPLDFEPVAQQPLTTAGQP